jgi:hypothetical protein
MKSSRLGKRAKLIPQVEVSTQRREGVGKPSVRLFLRRRALGVLDYFVDRRRKLIHARAWDDNGITAAVRFLGDAKEFAAVVFTKLDVKMLTLDLQLPRFDEIIHVCKKPRSLGLSRSKREADFLGKSACNGFVESRLRDRLTPSRASFRALISDGEVDLTFKGVDSRNENANFIPD